MQAEGETEHIVFAVSRLPPRVERLDLHLYVVTQETPVQRPHGNQIQFRVVLPRQIDLPLFAFQVQGRLAAGGSGLLDGRIDPHRVPHLVVELPVIVQVKPDGHQVAGDFLEDVDDDAPAHLRPRARIHDTRGHHDDMAVVACGDHVKLVAVGHREGADRQGRRVEKTHRLDIGSAGFSQVIGPVGVPHHHTLIARAGGHGQQAHAHGPNGQQDNDRHHQQGACPRC